MGSEAPPETWAPPGVGAIDGQSYHQREERGWGGRRSEEEEEGGGGSRAEQWHGGATSSQRHGGASSPQRGGKSSFSSGVEAALRHGGVGGWEARGGGGDARSPARGTRSLAVGPSATGYEPSDRQRQVTSPQTANSKVDRASSTEWDRAGNWGEWQGSEGDERPRHDREAGPRGSFDHQGLQWGDQEQVDARRGAPQVRWCFATHGPSWGYLKSQFSRDLVNFGR